MIDFLSLMQEFFPSFDSNSSFEGKFSRIVLSGGVVRGGIPLYVYMPPLTQRSVRACAQSAYAYGKPKQTMKTSRGYAPPAGENSLRGVRYSLDRFSFKRAQALNIVSTAFPREFKFYCSASRIISSIRKIQTKREVEGLRCKTTNID